MQTQVNYNGKNGGGKNCKSKARIYKSDILISYHFHKQNQLNFDSDKISLSSLFTNVIFNTDNSQSIQVPLRYAVLWKTFNTLEQDSKPLVSPFKG